MARPISITAEQQQKALRMYRNKSLTLKEIANLCDMSEQYLFKLVQKSVKNGEIQPRDNFRSGKVFKKKFTPKQLEEIAIDYYQNGMTTAQVVEKWGVHPMQLQRVRNKYQDIYGKKAKGHNVRVVQQFDTDNNFIAEFKSGYSASQQTGVCYQNIYQCCRGFKKSAGGFVWKFKGVQQNES